MTLKRCGPVAPSSLLSKSLKVDPELSDGTAPSGAGRVLIGCRYGLRSKDAEMNANDNPALNIEDSSTKHTIFTRK